MTDELDGDGTRLVLALLVLGPPIEELVVLREDASLQPELSYDLRSPSVHSEGSGGGRLRSLRTRPPCVPRRDVRSKIPAAPGGYYSAHRRVLGTHRLLLRQFIITVVKLSLNPAQA